MSGTFLTDEVWLKYKMKVYFVCITSGCIVWDVSLAPQGMYTAMSFNQRMKIWDSKKVSSDNDTCVSEVMHVDSGLI